MSVTIRRPLYSGSGFPLYNGSGLALSYEVTADSLEQAIFDLLTEVRAVLGGPGSTVFDWIGDKIAELGVTLQTMLGTPVGGYPGMIARLEDVWGATVNPATILTAIQNVRLDTAEPHIATIKDVLDALAAGVPAASLPNPAPAGYGGETASDIADAVWGYSLSYLNGYAQSGNLNTGSMLGFLLTLANIYAISEGQPDRRTPWFRWHSTDATLVCSPMFYDTPPAWATFPDLDFSTVLADDTVLSWLTREYPAWSWTTTAPVGQTGSRRVWAQVASPAPTLWLVCTLTDQDLHHLTATTPTGGATPPIWPGEDGVTLGTPIDVTESQVVVGPMDGCLVEVTDTESGAGKWAVGAVNSYYHGGYLAFIADNGAVDRIQYLGWETGIYAPSSVKQAASVLVYLNRVTRLTLTPWTLSG